MLSRALAQPCWPSTTWPRTWVVSWRATAYGSIAQHDPSVWLCHVGPAQSIWSTSCTKPQPGFFVLGLSGPAQFTTIDTSCIPTQVLTWVFWGWEREFFRPNTLDQVVSSNWVPRNFNRGMFGCKHSNIFFLEHLENFKCCIPSEILKCSKSL